MAITKGIIANAIKSSPPVEKIGFTEFTTKLVLDIFEALIKSNVNQIKAYADLNESVMKGVEEFIKNTKDSISDKEILDFLESLVLPTERIESVLDDVNIDKKLSEIAFTGPEIDIVKARLTNLSGDISADKTVSQLIEAISKRIAETKFSIVKQLTAMGVLRTVVNSGRIKTKLEFETLDLSTELSTKRKQIRDKSDFKGRLGADYNGLIGNGLLGVSGGIGGGFSKIVVKTSKNRNYEKSSDNVDILGEIEINFSTDYLPLANLD